MYSGNFCSKSTAVEGMVLSILKLRAIQHIYIYIYKYYEGKKGRNYVSRQACFVNRFTLQGFNERIFM